MFQGDCLRFHLRQKGSGLTCSFPGCFVREA